MNNLLLDKDSFNRIRREVDYPPLYKLFEDVLPKFDSWKNEQSLTQDIMFRHGLALFIISDHILNISIKQKKPVIFEGCNLDLNERLKSGWFDGNKRIEPYFMWLRNRIGTNECNAIKQKFVIDLYKDGSHFFMKSVPLRNLGYVQINNANLSGKLLDFVSLDGLYLNGPHNNSHLHIYCSSAVGLRIRGSCAFFNFKQTTLSDIQPKNNGMILENGTFQDFKFDKCHLDILMKSANITNLTVSNCALVASTELTKFDKNCKFEFDRKYRNGYQLESDFYDEVVKLFVNSNDYSSAGIYYYKSKKSNMLNKLGFRTSYRLGSYKPKGIRGKWNSLKRFAAGMVDLVNFCIWGFGERPSRTLLISFISIFLYSLIYLFSPETTTKNYSDSLYFSMVTFTTLGYGDISQHDSLLRLISALESLTGLILMGLFLAGYASKTKRY